MSTFKPIRWSNRHTRRLAKINRNWKAGTHLKPLLNGESWTDTGYVFVREDGLPIDLHTSTHLFRKLSNQAGLEPIRLHDLRHLHATI